MIVPKTGGVGEAVRIAADGFLEGTADGFLEGTGVGLLGPRVGRREGKGVPPTGVPTVMPIPITCTLPEQDFVSLQPWRIA